MCPAQGMISCTDETDDLSARPAEDRIHLAREEGADRRAAAQELPGQVDVDDFAPVIERHGVGGRVALQARIGDQDVEPAESRERLCEQALDLVFLGHIGLDDDSFAADLANGQGDLVGAVGVRAVVHSDAGAGRAERLGDGGADAGRGARDERRLPGEAERRTLARAARRRVRHVCRSR
jgi:hypothetical protein